MNGKVIWKKDCILYNRTNRKKFEFCVKLWFKILISLTLTEMSKKSNETVRKKKTVFLEPTIKRQDIYQ